MTASRRDLTLNDGTQIWLRKDTGIVESVKDWASSFHRQVFFLKFEDGTQKECDTTLINVGVGHKVTLVWGAKQGKDNGHYLGFCNLTTNSDAVYGERALRYKGFRKRKLGWLLLVVYSVFFCSLLYGCLKSMSTGPVSDVKEPVQLFFLWCIVTVGFVVYGLISRRHFKRFYKDLTSRVLAFLREGSLE